MISKFKFTTSVFILALGLNACAPFSDDFFGAPRTGNKATSSEELLAAEGSWSMVDENQETANPVALHNKARTVVNPDDRRKKQYIPQSRVEQAAGHPSGEDINFRLVRVEREVQNIRDDLDRIIPPLTELIEADQKLDATLKTVSANRKPQMQAYTVSGGQQAAPPSTAPRSATTYQPVTGAGTGIRNIRFGQHKTKTRVVLDLSGKAAFRSNIDNTEQVMIIELPGSSWNAQAEKVIRNPYIRSYTTQPSGNGGTLLALELKQPSRLIASEALPPNGSSGHRIYFDIAPL